MFDLNRIKAKLIFAKNTTFFTSLMYSQRIVIDNTQPSAYGTGRVIAFNESYMDSLDDSQQQFVLVHQLCHLAFNHFTRRGIRTVKRWNNACDYWVNHYLRHLGYSLTHDALIDNDLTHLMSVNEIYDLLPEECDAGDLAGDIQPDPDLTVEEEKEMDDLHTEATIRAAMTAELAKEFDTLPGGLQRRLEDRLNPQIPWNVALMNHLAATAKDDFSWSKPNRRFEDIYLPHSYSEGMGRISVYVDCSVSVTEEEFQAEISECQSIKDTFDPEEMVIVFFNSHIVSEFTFKRNEPLEVTLPKSGGTSITPVLRHMKDNPSDVAVVFSDGYFYTDENKPDTPIFWCIVNNTKFDYPFGEILHIKA